MKRCLPRLAFPGIGLAVLASFLGSLPATGGEPLQARPWAAGELHPIEPLLTAARRAGLRVLESRRLALITDRPVRDGDGVAELPLVFDQAFDAWCHHYGLDPHELPDWRACGCLVIDRERFRAAGLLPDDVPPFVNGFCHRNRFWLADQSNPAYRRHLLLHEGVHAFTITVRDLDTPVWYTEGIAEYLATHRLEPDADGGPRFLPTPLPAQRADVPQLGRIEQLRRLATAAPALADVLETRGDGHGDIAAYAASWAAVTLLARHPAHATAFTAVERGPLDVTFNDRLAAAPGWDAARATRDFDAFVHEVDYGFDFDRSAIDWSPGRLLVGPVRVAVAADRGWQNTGLMLEAGRMVTLAASGRVRVGEIPQPPPAAPTVLETEADGISLGWYRGRPLGRLLAAQWVDSPSDGGRPRFVVVAEGSRGEFAAVTTGPLFVKLNEAPGELADNEGSLDVEIAPTTR
jgi:hypothetical protein